MSNNKYQNILDSRNQQSAFDELVQSTNDIAETGYCAFEKGRNGKPETMLGLNFKDNKSKLFYYFEIREIEFNGDHLISIVRPHEIITITGDNLLKLRQYFADNRIKELHVFNPAIHIQKPTSDQPIIQEIIVTELKKTNHND